MIDENQRIEFKSLLYRAYQTKNYKEAFDRLKNEYLERFDLPLPYPLFDDLETFDFVCAMLRQKIEAGGLQEVVLISKGQVREKYKFTDKMFVLFYPEPEQVVMITDSRERFGKVQYAHLYNENKIIELLESEPVQVYLAGLKAKKDQVLDFKY